MKIIELDKPRRALNIKALFGALFFEPWVPLRHPDMKRQRSRRQRSLDLSTARALKTAYVPLCRVDPACYVEEEIPYVEMRDWFGSAYRRKVFYASEEVR